MAEKPIFECPNALCRMKEFKYRIAPPQKPRCPRCKTELVEKGKKPAPKPTPAPAPSPAPTPGQ